MDDRELRTMMFALMQANIDGNQDEYRQLFDRVPEPDKEALLHLALAMPAATITGYEKTGNRADAQFFSELFSALMYAEVEDPDA